MHHIEKVGTKIHQLEKGVMYEKAPQTQVNGKQRNFIKKLLQGNNILLFWAEMKFFLDDDNI